MTPASNDQRQHEARRLAKRARNIAGNAADPSDWFSVPLPGDEAEVACDVQPHETNEWEVLP